MTAAARDGHSLRRATIPDRDLDGRGSKNERGTKSGEASGAVEAGVVKVPRPIECVYRLRTARTEGLSPTLLDSERY